MDIKNSASETREIEKLDHAESITMVASYLRGENILRIVFSLGPGIRATGQLGFIVAIGTAFEKSIVSDYFVALAFAGIVFAFSGFGVRSRMVVCSQESLRELLLFSSTSKTLALILTPCVAYVYASDGSFIAITLLVAIFRWQEQILELIGGLLQREKSLAHAAIPQGVSFLALALGGVLAIFVPWGGSFDGLVWCLLVLNVVSIMYIFLEMKRFRWIVSFYILDIKTWCQVAKDHWKYALTPFVPMAAGALPRIYLDYYDWEDGVLIFSYVFFAMQALHVFVGRLTLSFGGLAACQTPSRIFLIVVGATVIALSLGGLGIGVLVFLNRTMFLVSDIVHLIYFNWVWVLGLIGMCSIRVGGQVLRQFLLLREDANVLFVGDLVAAALTAGMFIVAVLVGSEYLSVWSLLVLGIGSISFIFKAGLRLGQQWG